jgi:hypothetical protein
VGRLLDDLVLLRLATMPPTVVTVPQAPATQPPPLPTEPAPEDELTCDHIDAAQLSWPDASADQLDLMRRVYLRQVMAACQTRAFVGDVPDAELSEIENGVRARQAAADSCRRLLAAARAALTADPTAGSVSSVGLISGYRSASEQLANWNRNFPRYYRETSADRTALAGGEFGGAAAALLTRYISRRLAAPGFSLHNNGLAIDFVTVEGGVSMGADTSAKNRARWRRSWFFRWLGDNAAAYFFFQNTSIDEPWHWEFRAGTSASSQSLEAEATNAGEFLPAPDTVEPATVAEVEPAAPSELTIAGGRLELTNTPLLSTHRGTQPDLILRWNDMTDPAALDVVVHFHGYSSDRQRMSLRRKELYSGLDFSNPDNPSDTRPGRTAPTLGILPRGSYTGDAPDAKNPERYSFPALVTPSGTRDLIAYSLGQFQSTTGASADLSTRRLILTAHSGGGAALMGALAGNTPDEIYVFDALYGDASALVSWVNTRIAAEIQAWTAGKARADGGLCVLYRRGGTEGQSLRVHRALQSAMGTAPADAQAVLQVAYRVLRTTISHGDIPRRYGWLLLADVAQPLPAATPSESQDSPEAITGAILQEESAPAPEILETFTTVEFMDVEQWASVKHYTEEVDSVTSAYVETELLKSADFASIPGAAPADLTTLSLMRAVPSPSPGAPNYEFKCKSRIYYPSSTPGRVAGKRAFPVVVIVHGNHGWKDSTGTEIPGHLGYDYLQQELARNGIVSMSISTNPANMLASDIRTRSEFVLANLRILKRLNSTSGHRLENRLDLHNVGLMGHSRGGDAVVKTVVLNRGSADFTIRAVCSLAPTDFTGAARPSDRLKLEASDFLRYLVLYGSHDGDVSGIDGGVVGTGFRHYDRATCDKTMVFVKGITHNRFNTKWDNQPNYDDPEDCNVFGLAAPDVDLQSPADHQRLANEYIGGLFRLELNSETPLKGLFDGRIAPSGSHALSAQWSPSKSRRGIGTTIWGTPLDPTDRWRPGWTAFTPFKLPGTDQPHYLSYKVGNGEVDIDRLKPEGKGVDTIWGTFVDPGIKWRPGWTTFMPFKLPGSDQPHYLAYKVATGDVTIDRIRADGQGVDTIWGTPLDPGIKWRPGWTTFMPFKLPGSDQPHYLAYKVATGDVTIDRVRADGQGVDTIWGTPLDPGIKWRLGWTTFMPFQLPGSDQPHYLAYKVASGDVTIDRIKTDAQGVDTIWGTPLDPAIKWRFGWMSFIPFRLPGSDQPHYLAYKKDSGEIVIDRIRRDGQGTDTVGREQWTKGWTTFMPFDLAENPLFLAYKVATGEVLVERVNISAGLEIESFEDPTHNALGGVAKYTSALYVSDFRGGASAGLRTRFPLAIQHQIPVLRCDSSGAKYRADIPGAYRNFTDFDLLILRMASDFDLTSAAAISSGSLPNFKVRIFYGLATGGAAAGWAEASQGDIDTGGVRAPQRPFFHRDICEASPGAAPGTVLISTINVTKIALQTLAIPLSKFRGVTWNDVRAVEVEAGPGITAPLYVASLALVQSL